MSAALLVLWFATLGADRIDLLGGAGPFLLKPLLVLIPPIAVLELGRLARRERRLFLPPGVAWFFIAQSALLSVLLLSVMFSREPGLGLQRFALLAVESYSCLLIVIALVNREDSGKILRRGAWLGLGLILLFDVIQLSRWMGGYGFEWLSLGGIVELTPATYGPWLPRPSGVSVDPNRGGLLVIFYGYLLLAFAPASRLRTAALVACVPLLLVTLSRSAILAGVVVALFWLLRRRIRFGLTGVGVTSLAVAATAAALLVSPVLQQILLEVLEVVGQRVSVQEGSSSVHFSLLERGWEISTASVRNALLGIGFGNSFLVLQDFFPGTKYGNFHSAYMSLLVEAGIGAVVVFVVLLLRPLLKGSRFGPLIAGVLAFNVFYQTHVEATFWVIAALAWILPSATAPAAAVQQVEPGPQTATKARGSHPLAPVHSNVG